ncbi:transposase [Lentisphaera araneosa]|nr:transposase [Lentisphaera araneosa]
MTKTEERNLKRWCLVQEFREKLTKELEHHPRHPSEDDPRRKLHYLDYASAILFTLFNPVLKSMRGLCAASELKKVQEHVTLGKISLGSFSEAQHVFDATSLQHLVQKLSSKIPINKIQDRSLLAAVKDLVAVDGSLFQTLTRVLWAEWLDENHKAAKLHLGFSLLKQSAVDAVITAGNSCERKALLKMVQPGVMYVCDRYYGLDYSYLKSFNNVEHFLLFAFAINPNLL